MSVEQIWTDAPEPGDTSEVDVTAFGDYERTVLVYRFMNDRKWHHVATRHEPFDPVDYGGEE